MCTATRTSSYSPVGPSVFLCIWPRFVFCVFICVSLICLYVLILLCFPGQLSHLPYSFGASVTNLNEPPRALAASTIAWVRLVRRGLQLHPFWAVVNKSNAG